MSKLFRKKSNKKGFTLAELLIVVAIIAILVAIAIPIFTGMLEKAQIGVNKANARSVKGAAVAEILADWDNLKAGATADPSGNGKGWLAVGDVDAQGDVQSITVYINDDTDVDTTTEHVGDGQIISHSATSSAIYAVLEKGTKGGHKAESKGLTQFSGGGTGESNVAEKVESSGKIGPAYYVVVYIDDVKNITAGN